MSAKLRASSPEVFLCFIPVTCSEDPRDSSRETRCHYESSFSDVQGGPRAGTVSRYWCVEHVDRARYGFSYVIGLLKNDETTNAVDFLPN